jgi:predicted HicB family RNase H-like nuclease
MPEYMHRQLALEAMQQGVSLNQLLNLKLEASL